MTGTVVVIAVVVAILLASAATARNCPKCSTRIPPVRMPNTLRQMLWGGGTCPGCGSELDRTGRLVASRVREA